MMKQGSRLQGSNSITGPLNIIGIMIFGFLIFVHSGRED